jgi:hypothetical protein
MSKIRLYYVQLMVTTIPLADGRFIVDLAQTDEPGAEDARASVRESKLGNLLSTSWFLHEAVRLNAAHHGYDPRRAVSDAIFAELCIVTAMTEEAFGHPLGGRDRKTYRD